MTDTNDLREQAIKAAEKVTDVIDDLDLWHELVAESILAVAEPIIRAQVIEELAKLAEPTDAIETGGWHSVSGWLRAQLDEPDDKKIYIGFKDKQKDKDKDHD
jgi:cell division inhibitor SulA